MWLTHRSDFGSGVALGLLEPEAAGDSYLYRSAIRRLRVSDVDPAPVRVLFLGQETYFRGASCEGRSDQWDFRFLALDPSLSAISEWSNRLLLDSFDPHVIVMFRPERQASLARELKERAFVVGVLTEPLALHPWSSDRDLRARRRTYTNAKELNVDRLICAVPHYTRALERLFPVDSTVPLPVHDAIFRNEPLPIPHPSTGIFVGQMTPRRQQFLADLKHRYAWTVVDHGTQWIDPTPFSIGINIHAGNFANHEHRIFCHMAHGQVLLDEPFTHHFGLFSGIHRLVFDGRGSLLALVQAIEADPVPAQRVQIRARHAVERFRSSRVWPRVIMNLLVCDRPR